ncbi:hypothetical protein SAMN04488065_1303 [Haloplanus vescus]|uniref:Uncharacterized protein n=1 Tax=Haloplanus vescus TaxID=555874 RepID=A0A1H3X1X6_9EURY|nr:hypothetical protein [Haloplanus vescus]SDZ93397.1 hypothetical protein SAMN04488065_1303 [Haloplanus vescus]
MSGAGVLVLFLCLGVGAPLVLYWLVRAEHDRREEMSRSEAERAARRDVPDDERGRR